MAAEGMSSVVLAHTRTLSDDDSAKTQQSTSSGHGTTRISYLSNDVASTEDGCNGILPSLLQMQHLTCTSTNDDFESGQKNQSQVSSNVEVPRPFPSMNNLQGNSVATPNSARTEKAVGLVRQENGRLSSRSVQKRKRQLPTSKVAEPKTTRRSSRETTAHAAKKIMSRTEQQLLTSQSNYEIIQSGERSVHRSTFPPSLLAIVKRKRTQHQREEQIRRDRMKVALEALANSLPQASDAPKNVNKVELVEKATEHIKELRMQLDATIHANRGTTRVDDGSGDPS